MMPIAEICNRNVVIVEVNDTILNAAKLMRKHHVGDVIIVKKSNGSSIPVGIVTDRDLVIEVMAPEIDPSVLTVGDIMKRSLATVKDNAGVFETVQHMRSKSVRRMPVVDDGGNLLGIVTLDDLLQLLIEELSLISKIIRHEQLKEISARP